MTGVPQQKVTDFEEPINVHTASTIQHQKFKTLDSFIATRIIMLLTNTVNCLYPLKPHRFIDVNSMGPL